VLREVSEVPSWKKREGETVKKKERLSNDRDLRKAVLPKKTGKEQAGERDYL